MLFRDDETGEYDLLAILAAVMILASLFEVVDDLRMWLPDFGLVETLVNSDVVMDSFIAIGGLALIASRRMDYSVRMALAGLAIGLSFVARHLFFAEFYGEFLWFIVGVVAFMTGVMATVASVSLLCGYFHYASRLFQCLAVMTLVEAFPIWVCYHYEIPFDVSFRAYYWIFPLIAVYITALVCLHHESVRIPSVTEKVDGNMRTMADMMYSSADTFMVPEDAVRLEDFIGSGDAGSIDIVLHGDGGSRVLTIVRNEGQVPTATVMPESGRALMDGFRFEIRSLVHDGGDMVRIYGRTGVFVQIMVHPIPPKKRARDRIGIRVQKED